MHTLTALPKEDDDDIDVDADVGLTAALALVLALAVAAKVEARDSEGAAVPDATASAASRNGTVYASCREESVTCMCKCGSGQNPALPVAQST